MREELREFFRRWRAAVPGQQQEPFLALLLALVALGILCAERLAPPPVTSPPAETAAADVDGPTATMGLYPPGSTFKLITAAAALENGYTSTSQIASPSSLTLPQSSSKLTNQVNCGGSKVSLDQALQTSCNTAFANLGLALGQDKLRAQAQKERQLARQVALNQELRAGQTALQQLQRRLTGPLT